MLSTMWGLKKKQGLAEMQKQFFSDNLCGECAEKMFVCPKSFTKWV